MTILGSVLAATAFATSTLSPGLNTLIVVYGFLGGEFFLIPCNYLLSIIRHLGVLSVLITVYVVLTMYSIRRTADDSGDLSLNRD